MLQLFLRKYRLTPNPNTTLKMSPVEQMLARKIEFLLEKFLPGRKIKCWHGTNEAKLTDCDVTGLICFGNIVVIIFFTAVWVHVKNQILVVFSENRLIVGKTRCDPVLWILKLARLNRLTILEYCPELVSIQEMTLEIDLNNS